MIYEWKVCNSAEITAVRFPYMEKTIVMENFYDQSYRIYETEKAISLYQPGKRNIVLFKADAGTLLQFGNDYYHLELLEDGTYDVYHAQQG